MVIKEIKIYSFGTHKNKTWTFSDGLNVIYGENETGKTTLFAFIRSVLYGLSGRGAENFRKKYYPWNFNKAEDKFGGELIFSHKDIEYRAVAVWGESKKEDSTVLYNNVSGSPVQIPQGRTIGEYVLLLTAGAYDSSIYIGQMSSVIKADDDKTGHLSEKLSAASGFTESEASASTVISRIKTSMDKIRAPRSGNGILDRLDVDRIKWDNAMSRIALTDENAAKEEAIIAEKEKTAQTYENRIKDVQFCIDIIDSSAVIKKKNSITSLLADLKVMKEEYEKEENKKQTFLAEADNIKKPFSWYVPTVLYFVFAAAAIIAAAFMWFLPNMLLAGIFAGTALCAVLLGILSAVGIKKKTSAVKEELLKKAALSDSEVKRISAKIADIEGGISEKSDGLTLEELSVKWEKAKEILDTATPARLAEIASTPREQYEESLKELQNVLNEINIEIARLRAGLEAIYLSEKMPFCEAKAGHDKNLEDTEFYTRKYLALELAKKIAEESFETLHSTYGMSLNERTSEILEKISGSKENIKIDDNFDVSVFDDVKPRDISSYSGGAVDQTYFALRLAIAQIIAPKGQPYPLLLDDPFAQYDDERARNAMNYLDGIKDTQIIITTCRSRVAGQNPLSI